jgi:hypothetical protein
MVRLVSVLMDVVVGLTVLFGVGNVLSLALRLGVPAYVAPLIAPAVDLAVVGLLLGTRYLLGSRGRRFKSCRPDGQNEPAGSG